MARNIKLLTEIRDLIERYPTRLNMRYWTVIPKELVEFNGTHNAKVECGTTQCVAGWAVQLSGWQFLVHPDNEFVDGANTFSAIECIAKNGRVADIEDKARQLLGLTEDEANWLFFLKDEQVIPALNRLIAGDDPIYTF